MLPTCANSFVNTSCQQGLHEKMEADKFSNMNIILEYTTSSDTKYLYNQSTNFEVFFKRSGGSFKQSLKKLYMFLLSGISDRDVL